MENWIFPTFVNAWNMTLQEPVNRLKISVLRRENFLSLANLKPKLKLKPESLRNLFPKTSLEIYCFAPKEIEKNEEFS
jgi:hypothetical protein